MNTQSLIQDALGKLEEMKKKPTRHPVPCPEGIVGCAVYHCEERLSNEDKAFNNALSDIQGILPEIIERVVLGLVPDEIRMAEVDFKGEVPVDVLSDVMEFTTDPTFHKGWNQCREKILASLKENKV